MESSSTASRFQGELACFDKRALSDLIELSFSSFLRLRQLLSAFWLIVVIYPRVIIKPTLLPHFNNFTFDFLRLATRAGRILNDRPLALLDCVNFLRIIWSIAVTGLREYAPAEVLPRRPLLFFRPNSNKGKVNCRLFKF